MKLNYKMYFNTGFLLELLFFVLTQFFGFFVAFNYLVKAELYRNTSSVDPMPVWIFIIAFVIATSLIYVLVKILKLSKIVKWIFYIAIIEGLWIFAESLFDRTTSIIFLIFILSLWLYYNNILIHNFIIMMAGAAIAVLFGFNFLPNILIYVLLGLAIYDFWAVYKTKHMVTMFRELSKQKINFAIIIPAKIRDLFMKIKHVDIKNQFMFLGTGDLIIPLIFSISCLNISLRTSIFSAIGSILGFVFLYTIFIKQKMQKPMPGLPPLVLGTLCGYLLSFL